MVASSPSPSLAAIDLDAMSTVLRLFKCHLYDLSYKMQINN